MKCESPGNSTRIANFHVERIFLLASKDNLESRFLRPQQTQSGDRVVRAPPPPPPRRARARRRALASPLFPPLRVSRPFHFCRRRRERQKPPASDSPAVTVVQLPCSLCSLPFWAVVVGEGGESSAWADGRSRAMGSPVHSPSGRRGRLVASILPRRCEQGRRAAPPPVSQPLAEPRLPCCAGEEPALLRGPEVGEAPPLPAGRLEGRLRPP